MELSDPDKAAVLALLSRWIRAYDGVQHNTALRQQIETDLKQQKEDLEKLNQALSIFDIKTNVENWGKRIREAVGSEAYESAVRAGGRNVGNSKSVETSETQATVQATNASDASVRELTLDKLRQAGDAGVDAKNIREHIEKIRDIKLHYKTVGMTLYRLAQDGLARREGRTWFAVPETANPGAATPGSSTKVQEER